MTSFRNCWILLTGRDFMKRMISGILTGAAVLFLVCACQVYGQNPQNPQNNRPGPGAPDLLRGGTDADRIQTWMFSYLEKYLGLDRNASRRMRPIFMEYIQNRDKLMREHTDLTGKITAGVENNTVSIDDLKNMSRRYQSIDRLILMERDRFYRQAQDILDDRQMIKLVVFEEKVKEDLFKRFRDMRGGPPSRGDDRSGQSNGPRLDRGNRN
jgi:hypothetical protein